jgi:hypothetical protein
MRTKDNTVVVMGMGFTFSICLLLASAHISKGEISFDSHSSAVATTIGEIVGSVFGSLTLLVLLSNYLSETRDRNFRQALDFAERLSKVYTSAHQQYFEVGKKTPVPGADGKMEFGNIIPYLKLTQPLFSVVMSHLQTSQFSPIQYQAVVSILRAELVPMIKELDEEIDVLGRSRDVADNQIAHKQLEAINSLKSEVLPTE